MNFLIPFTLILVILSKSVESNDFPKAITLKLLYQLITGELSSKPKQKIDSKLRNGTSNFLGEIINFILI
jgi:hypothetical protein